MLDMMIKKAVVTEDTPSAESGARGTIDLNGESFTVKEASAVEAACARSAKIELMADTAVLKETYCTK